MYDHLKLYYTLGVIRISAIGDINSFFDDSKSKSTHWSQQVFGIVLSVLYSNINQIIMKVTLSIIAGFAVGVGIGLLIAPEKGDETRRRLVNSAGDWMEKLKNLFSAVEEETSPSSSESHQPAPQTF